MPACAPSCTDHQVGSSRLIGGLASECSVASFSVVVLEPRRKGGCSFVVAGDDLPVGPHGGQGQSFDVPVLPWAVRADGFLGAAALGADAAE